MKRPGLHGVTQILRLRYAPRRTTERRIPRRTTGPIYQRMAPLHGARKLVCASRRKTSVPPDSVATTSEKETVNQKYRQMLHDLAMDTHGVVTTSQARQHGIPPVALRNIAAVDEDVWRIARGVYRLITMQGVGMVACRCADMGRGLPMMEIVTSSIRKTSICQTLPFLRLIWLASPVSTSSVW